MPRRIRPFRPVAQGHRPDLLPIGGESNADDSPATTLPILKPGCAGRCGLQGPLSAALFPCLFNMPEVLTEESNLIVNAVIAVENVREIGNDYWIEQYKSKNAARR